MKDTSIDLDKIGHTIKPPVDGEFEPVVLLVTGVPSEITGDVFDVLDAELVSKLRHRIERGSMLAEVGSGRGQALPGFDSDSYDRAKFGVTLDKVGAIITDLEFIPREDGAVALVGKFKPTGPRKDFLDEDRLKTTPLRFALRAVPNEYVFDGQRHQKIHDVISWDLIADHA